MSLVLLLSGTVFFHDRGDPWEIPKARGRKRLRQIALRPAIPTPGARLRCRARRRRQTSLFQFLAETGTGRMTCERLLMGLDLTDNAACAEKTC
jgi:hypothetical protein